MASLASRFGLSIVQQVVHFPIYPLAAWIGAYDRGAAGYLLGWLAGLLIVAGTVMVLLGERGTADRRA